MRPSALVRRGVAADADTLAWIGVVARAAYYGHGSTSDRTPRPTPEQVEQWRRRLAAPLPAIVLVAEIAGEAVGKLAVGPGESPDVLQLKSFWVLPHLWGRGVGTALHQAFVDHLHAMGYSRAVTWVWDANPRGQTFSLEHGWQPDGREMPGPRHSRFICMQLRLPAETADQPGQPA